MERKINTTHSADVYQQGIVRVHCCYNYVVISFILFIISPYQSYFAMFTFNKTKYSLIFLNTVYFVSMMIQSVEYLLPVSSVILLLFILLRQLAGAGLLYICTSAKFHNPPINFMSVEKIVIVGEIFSMVLAVIGIYAVFRHHQVIMFFVSFFT